MDSPVMAVASSPAGSMAAVACHDGHVAIYDLIDQTITAQLRVQQGSVLTVEFSPGGSRLATGGSAGIVSIWDAKQQRLIHECRHHKHAVRQVRYSSSGHILLSASLDESVALWDARTGDLLDYLQHGTVHGCYCVDLAPNEGVLAEGSFDTTIRLWTLGPDSRVQRKLAAILAREESDIGANFRQRDRQKRLEEARARKKAQKLAYFNAAPAEAPTAPVARELSPLGQQEPERVLEGHSAPVVAVRFSPDGQMLASASHDGTVILWDTFDGTQLAVLEANTRSPVWTCSFSNDGSILCLGSGDGHIDFFDALTRSLLLSFQAHTSYVTATCFSADGLNLLTGSHDSTNRAQSSGLSKMCVPPRQTLSAALAMANSKAQAELEQSTARHLKLMARKERHRELGVSVPGLDVVPNAELQVCYIHCVPTPFMSCRGCRTILEMNELHPGDLERQLYFEQSLLRTLRYRPFALHTLQKLATASDID
ncbi:uncharacterized protein MONBRDRAFT_24633 [Monosiga brevicollis MX1]|uniref:Anaphase-promoting complex subunit 4 WD40 domain-containing protein n=1 Tax=Monosiga brevicollis TaxID=81824 RepID=A9UX09_MONBE|nr:uncharacterized protein MONBRDRAFT_24633 [Monosiga brevicollis MX1]EDQ90311.1 predicted protein [Monosiga brevicollis MX1]|eukprot:XP_001745078.1 hypothetical protein [Monosiga brevicollis MX1]